MTEVVPESPIPTSGAEFARYLSLLRRWWWLLAAGPLIAGVTAFLVTRTITPTYEGSATILVHPAQGTGALVYNDILASERLTKTYRELISQRPVLEDVVVSEQFSGLTVDQLSAKLRVNVVRDTQLLKIVVRDEDPALAAELADAVAVAFVAQQQRPSAARPGAASLVESAIRPSYPVSPNVRLNVALSLVVGLLLAVGVVLVMEYLDDTVKSPDDVEANLGQPTLGEIGRWRGQAKKEIRLVERSDGAGTREAYGVLRTNVQFSTLNRPGRVVLVTSAGVSEGKSTTAVNYALAVAEAGRTVALVDADLRQPALHRAFGLSNGTGLSFALLNGASIDGGVLRPTSSETLFLMNSGPLPPNPAELLDSDRFDTVLERLKERFDVVVLDSPPVLIAADARILASKADATILVVESDRTRTGTVRRALRALATAKANVLGIVLNKTRRSGRSYSYYYYSHYARPAEQASSRISAGKRLSIRVGKVWAWLPGNSRRARRSYSGEKPQSERKAAAVGGDAGRGRNASRPGFLSAKLGLTEKWEDREK